MAVRSPSRRSRRGSGGPWHSPPARWHAAGRCRGRCDCGGRAGAGVRHAAAVLAKATGSSSVTTMVHGKTLADAKAAVADAGLREVTSYDRIGVVVARGTADQVEAAPKPTA